METETGRKPPQHLPLHHHLQRFMRIASRGSEGCLGAPGPLSLLLTKCLNIRAVSPESWPCLRGRKALKSPPDLGGQPAGNWMGDPQLASDRARGGSVISQAGFELCRSGPSGYLHGPGESEAEKEAFDFCSLSAALSVTPWLGGFQQHGWDRPADEEDPEAF
ncbi:hypothetical protein MHYP_G00051150 [Metynnis hypsauchen]